MTIIKTKNIFCFIFLFFSLHIIAGNAAKDEKPHVSNLYGTSTSLSTGSGMCFTSNNGQIADINGKLRPDILYKGDGGGADIYIRTTGISYVYSNIGKVFHEVNEQVEELTNAGMLTIIDGQRKRDELIQKQNIKIHRVDMDFENCLTNIRTINEDEIEGYRNFYYAHCPQGITHVKQYNKITTKNIYKGIDISYYGSKEHGLKYDIVVQPHADPNQIKLKWSGAEDIHINREGNLVIKTSVNEFTESIPKVYQNINGKIVDVKAEYSLESIVSSAKSKQTSDSRLPTSDYFITFSLSNYQIDFPLVIDPWATYCGGTGASGNESGTSICNDAAGNVIAVGKTDSPDFPFSTGAQQITYGGQGDCFIIKFTSTGTMVFATYFGGSDKDWPDGVVADLANNVIVAGSTNSVDFPTQNPAGGAYYKSTKTGLQDAFIAKFTPAGVLIWSTYYGGSDTDQGFAVDKDGANNIFFYGDTNSSDFPVTTGAYQASSAGMLDYFIVKFSSAGASLWSTYYGGNSLDYGGGGIGCDQAGDVFICGNTLSTNFPVISAYQPVKDIGSDGFVAKLNGNTGFPVWSTYYGGNSFDLLSALGVDGVGDVIVQGITGSTNNISSAGTHQPIFGGGGQDLFAGKFANNTGVRTWGTYIGGVNNEYDDIKAGQLAIDAANNIYIYGEFEESNSGNFTISSCAYQPVLNGYENQFISKYNPAGQRLCATYFGGTGESDLDMGEGISLYGNFLYITGATGAGYPVTANAYQSTFAGPVGGLGSSSGDAFVAQLCINLCEAKVLGLNYIADATSVCPNVPITFTPSVANSCDTVGYRFQWTFTGGSPSSSTAIKPIVTFSGVGTHDVKLVVTTICKKDSLIKSNYITINSCGCTLTGQFIKGTTNCSGCGCKEWVMVTASGGTTPYAYNWNGGYDKRYQNYLCPGAYTIKITDKSGCSVNVNLTTP